MMRTAPVERRDDNITHNGRENVNSAPLGVTTTAALMDPYTSTAEEQKPKNCPT